MIIGQTVSQVPAVIPEWVKLLLSALAGGAVTGFFLLLADYLRHKRREKERYQEILIEKRVAGCADLVRRLIEFHADLSPLVHGAEPLRWPKDKRISPNPSDEDKKHAQRIDQRISELSFFVSINQMILGPRVMKAWNVYFGAFMNLRTRAKFRPEDDAVVIDALMKLLPESFDEIANAVKEELRGADLTFLSESESRALFRKGQQKAEGLVAKARAEITGASEAEKKE